MHNNPYYDYIPPMPYDEIFDPDYKGNIDGTAIEQSNKINPKMDRRDLEHIKALYDGEIFWTDAHLEKHNLIDTKSEIRSKLKKRLLGWVKRKQSQMVNAPKAQQDEETIQQLKSLGYIQ